MGQRLTAFLRLSRIPFLTPGLAPFTAGLLLGLLHGGGALEPGLVAIAYAGLILIMLATYYSNEYFDYEVDRINRNYNKFSGGSRVLPEGLLPRETAFKAFIGAVVAFAMLTLAYLKLYYQARPWLLAMGAIGMFAGVFYTTPPIRWAYRGLGETWILFSYGILAVASGYYVATGTLALEALLLSLPAAFSVFAVIVINEFPDYEADRVVGKRNLVVRLGRERAAYLYAFGLMATAVTLALAAAVISGLPGILLSIPLVALLAFLLAGVLRGDYRDPARLEGICAKTIIANALASYPPVLALLLLSV